MGKALELTTTIFDDAITHSDVPVLVDFWAPWCGPCRQIAPILDQMAQDLDGKVKIFKVNAQDEAALSERFKILTLPTFIVFEKGKEKTRRVGAAFRSEIEAILK